MFGYVCIDKSEMLVKDYDAYTAVYCSLCRQLGKEYTFLSRLILSYDCTFYAVLALSVSDECPGFCQGRCTFNPAKKCSYIKSSEHALSRAAALSVASVYYKLLDNICDGGLLQKIGCYILLPFFSRWRKKAAVKFPEIDKALADMMSAQRSVELDSSCCIDLAAEPTAKMLSQIMGTLADKNSDDFDVNRRIYSTLGYYIGKWIYLMDAAADIDDDIKHDNFNPFVICYDDPKNHIDEINNTLNHSLSEALLSYNLMKINRFERIIENILLRGLPKKQHSVLYDENNK